MKVESMRWYRIVVDGVPHVVRVDGRIMKWCVVDYYDAAGDGYYFTCEKVD